MGGSGARYLFKIRSYFIAFIKQFYLAPSGVIRRRVKDKNAFSHYQVHDSVLSRKLYDNTGRSFRLTTAKKQGKKFLYYYNGVGEHYLPVEQLDNFVLKTLKMTDFDDLEPLANRDKAGRYVNAKFEELSNFIKKYLFQVYVGFLSKQKI